MFNSNEMRELAYVKADRYQRAGGGGAHKVHATAQAYYNARGFKELSVWDQAIIEARHGWKQTAELAIADFRWEARPDRQDVEGMDQPFQFPFPTAPTGVAYRNVKNTF